MGNSPTREKLEKEARSHGAGKDSSSDSSRNSSRLGRMQRQTSALTKPTASLMGAVSKAGGSGVVGRKQITETITEVKTTRTRLNIGEVTKELSTKTTRFNGLNMQGDRVKGRLEVKRVAASSTTLKRGHPAVTAVASKKAKTTTVPKTKSKTAEIPARRKPVPNVVFYGTMKLNIPMARRKLVVAKTNNPPTKNLVTKAASKKAPVVKARVTKSASSPKSQALTKRGQVGVKASPKRPKRAQPERKSSPGPMQQLGVTPMKQKVVSGAKASAKQGRPITRVKARLVTKPKLAKKGTPKRQTKVIKSTKVVSKRKPEKNINVKVKKDTLPKPTKVTRTAKVGSKGKPVKTSKLKPKHKKVKITLKNTPKGANKVTKTKVAKVASKGKATYITKIKPKSVIQKKAPKKLSSAKINSYGKYQKVSKPLGKKSTIEATKNKSLQLKDKTTQTVSPKIIKKFPQNIVPKITKNELPKRTTKLRNKIVSSPVKVINWKSGGITKIRLRDRLEKIPRVINIKPHTLPLEVVKVVAPHLKVSPRKETASKKVFAPKVLPKSSVMIVATRESRSCASKTNISKPGKKINDNTKITKVLPRGVTKLRSPGRPVKVNKLSKVTKDKLLSNKVVLATVQVLEQPSLINNVKLLEVESKIKKPENKKPINLQGKIVQGAAKIITKGKPVKISKSEPTDRSTRASKVQLHKSPTKVQPRIKHDILLSKIKSRGRFSKVSKATKIKLPGKIVKSVDRPVKMSKVMKPVQKEDASKVLDVSKMNEKLAPQISIARSRGIPQKISKYTYITIFSKKVASANKRGRPKVRKNLFPKSPEKVIKSITTHCVITKPLKNQAEVSAIAKPRQRPAKTTKTILKSTPPGELIKAISANLHSIVGKPAKMINDNITKVLNKDRERSSIKSQTSPFVMEGVTKIQDTPTIRQDSVQIMEQVSKLSGRSETEYLSKAPSSANVTTKKSKEGPVSKAVTSIPSTVKVTKVKPQKKPSNDTKFGLKIKPRRSPVITPKITKHTPKKTAKITKQRIKLPSPVVKPHEKPAEVSKMASNLTSLTMKMVSTPQGRPITKSTLVQGKAVQPIKTPAKSPIPTKITTVLTPKLRGRPADKKAAVGKPHPKTVTPPKKVTKSTSKSPIKIITIVTPKLRRQPANNSAETGKPHSKIVTLPKRVTKSTIKSPIKTSTIVTPKLRRRPASNKVAAVKLQAKTATPSKVNASAKSPSSTKSTTVSTVKLRGRPPTKLAIVKSFTPPKVTKTLVKSPSSIKITTVLIPKLRGRPIIKVSSEKHQLKPVTSSKVMKTPVKQQKLSKITQIATSKLRGRSAKADKSTSNPAKMKHQKVPIVIIAKPRGQPANINKIMLKSKSPAKLIKLTTLNKISSPKKDFIVKPSSKPSTPIKLTVKHRETPSNLPPVIKSSKKIKIQNQPASITNLRGRPPKQTNKNFTSKVTKSQIKLRRGRPASLTKSIDKIVSASNSAASIVKLFTNKHIVDTSKVVINTQGRHKGSSKIDKTTAVKNTQIFRDTSHNIRLTRNRSKLVESEKIVELGTQNQVRKIKSPRNGSLVYKIKSANGLVSNLKREDKLTKLKRRSVSFSPKVQCQEFYSSDDENAPRDRRGKRIRCVPFSIPLDSGVVTQYLAWQSEMVHAGLPVKLPREAKSPVKPAQRTVRRALDLGAQTRNGKPGPVVIKLQTSPQALKASGKPTTRNLRTPVKELTKPQTAMNKTVNKPSTSRDPKPEKPRTSTRSAANPKVASKPRTKASKTVKPSTSSVTKPKPEKQRISTRNVVKPDTAAKVANKPQSPARKIKPSSVTKPKPTNPKPSTSSAVKPKTPVKVLTKLRTSTRKEVVKASSVTKPKPVKPNPSTSSAAKPKVTSKPQTSVSKIVKQSTNSITKPRTSNRSSANPKASVKELTKLRNSTRMEVIKPSSITKPSATKPKTAVSTSKPRTTPIVVAVHKKARRALDLGEGISPRSRHRTQIVYQNL